MLSLQELIRTAGILDSSLTGARIQKAVQPDEFRLALSFYGAGVETVLLLNCRPGFARISRLAAVPKAPARPPAFVQYFRAHLGRAVLESVRAVEEDRRVSFRLRSGEGIHVLLLSILGRRSNIYLLDSEQTVLQAMRPLEETRRELVQGAKWFPPEGKLKSEGTDRWGECSGMEYLSAVEEFYSQLERDREIEDLSRRIEQALAREASFLARKAANLAEDLGKAAHAQEQRTRGELLKGALHLIRPGAEEVTVRDYESGGDVVIPLDPKLSPAENLESYFNRYQRKQRATEAIRKQLTILGKSQAEIESLQSELRFILRDADLTALENLAGRPRLRKLLRSRRSSGTSGPKVTASKGGIPGRLMPRRFRTDQGFEIWVGRNDESNDVLTTRMARGKDLFFHLEGYPGSHVVLRTEGRRDVPSESILDACELAVHFSKLRSADRVDVHMAPIKNVKKPKGAKHGLVYVTGGKTIHLRRDPKRLENILASRIEE
jgi:predicted ribosome quality control (RQC) complex YloA/Tae2 family protein